MAGVTRRDEVDLGLSDDQEQLVATLERLCRNEATPERVRDAEPGGFDDRLWSALTALGFPGMGAPEALGGGGAGVLDLALACEVLGGALAPVPFVEHAVAARALARVLPEGDPILDAVIAGERIATVAPVPAAGATARAVPAAGVAEVVVALDGDALVLVERDAAGAVTPNLGASPVAPVSLDGAGRRVLREGEVATRTWRPLLDEWRVLTAAALTGLGAQALSLGVEYAKTRQQFGVPIGSFQAIAHALADAATAIDGARLLAREAAWAADEEPVQRTALAAMAFAFCSRAAQQAAGVSLHTHGGYGFMLEYDIQLAYRRAKGWALMGGDPRRGLHDLADALFGPAVATAGGR